MNIVYLGLGSNIRPAHHLPLGLRALRSLLGELSLSPVYEGAAIGFDGAPFWNLVVGARTALGVGELHRALRAIEFAHGRPPDATRHSPRTLDIDILTHGDRVGSVDGVELPRAEILERAFVLRPLAELAPATRHPVLRRSYADLWRDYDHDAEPLQPVALPPADARYPRGAVRGGA